MWFSIVTTQVQNEGGRVVRILDHSSVHSHRADYYLPSCLPSLVHVLPDALATIHTQLSSVVQTSHYSTLATV